MTTTILDWRAAAHWNDGRREPCQHCGQLTFLLDESGLPAHKTCVERVLAAGGG